jgi:two-component system, NtrC family, sensor kinase
LNHQEAKKEYRILVIDDNRAIHEDFRKVLCAPNADTTGIGEAEAKLFGEPIRARQSAVFEIDSAYQGEEGLERVHQSLQSGRP